MLISVPRLSLLGVANMRPRFQFFGINGDANNITLDMSLN